MKEILLLFGREIARLKKSGWEHRILRDGSDDGIWGVEVDIPDEVCKELSKRGGFHVHK